MSAIPTAGTGLVCPRRLRCALVAQAVVEVDRLDPLPPEGLALRLGTVSRCGSGYSQLTSQLADDLVIRTID
jgi:hypothetical protein